MNGQYMLRAESVEDLNDRSQQVHATNADELPADSCGVRQGTDEVEYGANAEFSSQGRDAAQSRMEGGCV